MTVDVIGKENFQKEVLDFSGVVIVDFYAKRCGPCLMLGPILQEISERYDSLLVKVVKVNVDENPELSSEFNIVSIPQVFIFKAGKQLEQLTGVNPKTVYTERVDLLLAQ